MFQIQSVRNLNRGKVSLLAIDDNLSVTASDTMPLISIRLSDIRRNLFTMKLFYQKKKNTCYLRSCFRKVNPKSKHDRRLLWKWKRLEVALRDRGINKIVSIKVMVRNRFQINTTHLKTCKYYSYDLPKCLWTQINPYPNVIAIVKLSLQLLHCP